MNAYTYKTGEFVKDEYSIEYEVKLVANMYHQAGYPEDDDLTDIEFEYISECAVYDENGDRLTKLEECGLSWLDSEIEKHAMAITDNLAWKTEE